jgi:hypothetical protein
LQIDHPTITSKCSGQAVKACLMPVATRLSAIVLCAPTVVRRPATIACGAPPVVGGLRGVAPRRATVGSIALLRRSVALSGRPVASLRRQVALLSSSVPLAVASQRAIRRTCPALPRGHRLNGPTL